MHKQFWMFFFISVGSTIHVNGQCCKVPPEDGKKNADSTRPTRMALWSSSAPIDQKSRINAEDENAFITIHQPAKPSGIGVVICPGGGYGGLVVGPEGHQIASWLTEHGITGVVLEYRLPKQRHRVPLYDVQRAVRYLRSEAGRLGLRSDRIGVMGFSAGGHLAATATTHFDAGYPDSEEVIQQFSCRPDFAVLVYPVVTMGPVTHAGSKLNLLGDSPSSELVEFYSNETQVTEKTPPVFLTHAVDDRPVPIENSRLLYQALKRKGIPARLLELPSGGHGLNGYKGSSWDAWQEQSLQWMLEAEWVSKK